MKQAEPEKRRLTVPIAIIALCLVGGGVGYYLLSGPGGSKEQAVTQSAAEVRQAEIAEQMQKYTPEAAATTTTTTKTPRRGMNKPE